PRPRGAPRRAPRVPAPEDAEGIRPSSTGGGAGSAPRHRRPIGAGRGTPGSVASIRDRPPAPGSPSALLRDRIGAAHGVVHVVDARHVPLAGPDQLRVPLWS